MARRGEKRSESPTPAASKLILPWWLSGWLLLTLCAVVYWPALHGAFLWDDNAHVTRGDLQSLAGLGRIWFELGATQQYYPVLHSAFWIEHQLWGDSVVGYHAWNILLHAISAGLIVVIMRRLALRGAWLAGLIFAVHPVAAESVAWISEQKNTLSTVFCLGALLAWLRFDQSRDDGSTPSPRHWRWYALATGLYILAVLSKTVTVTLPAALLVIGWWRRGRLDWRRDIAPLMPWFALGIAAGLMTAWVEHTIIGASGEAFDLNLWQRCLLAGRVVWFYFGKLIWPGNLAFIYPRWDMTVFSVWSYVALLAAMGVLFVFWKYRHRSRGPLASALLFGGTLFPALGFFNVYPFQFSYVADHFQYLSSIAIIVAAAAGLSLLAEKIGGMAARIRLAGAALLLVVLATLTWRQAHEYRDNITLYRATLAKNPTCLLATYNLGMELAGIGETAEAIDLYHAALRLKPGYAEVHANLAMSLMTLPGGTTEAIAELEKAVRLKPDLWVARINLANLLSSVPGREEDAVQLYQDVLRFDPAKAEVRYNLGLLLRRSPSRHDEALFQFETALRLNPDYWQARYQMAVLLMARHERLDDAASQLEAVLRVQPDYVGAHLNLGKLLLQFPGRRGDAITHLETALRLNPNTPEARQLLLQVRR